MLAPRSIVRSHATFICTLHCQFPSEGLPNPQPPANMAHDTVNESDAAGPPLQLDCPSPDRGSWARLLGLSRAILSCICCEVRFFVFAVMPMMVVVVMFSANKR